MVPPGPGCGGPARAHHRHRRRARGYEAFVAVDERRHHRCRRRHAHAGSPPPVRRRARIVRPAALPGRRHRLGPAVRSHRHDRVDACVLHRQSHRISGCAARVVVPFGAPVARTAQRHDHAGDHRPGRGGALPRLPPAQTAGAHRPGLGRARGLRRLRPSAHRLRPARSSGHSVVRTFLAGLVFAGLLMWRKRVIPLAIGHWLLDLLGLGLPVLLWSLQ